MPKPQLTAPTLTESWGSLYEPLTVQHVAEKSVNRCGFGLPPEMQRTCVAWAEQGPEVSGPARKEVAPWEEVEEAGVEEVLPEVHASSAASDHLLTCGVDIQRNSILEDKPFVFFE